MPRRKGTDRETTIYAQRFVEGLLEEAAKNRDGGVRLPPLFETAARQLKLLLSALNNKQEKRASRGRY